VEVIEREYPLREGLTAKVTWYYKPDEMCVIMKAEPIAKKPAKGELPTLAKSKLSGPEEEAAIALSKEDFEAEYGIRLLHFCRDPVAGGSVPLRDPGIQVIKPGVLRAEAFTERGVYQGKLGPVLDDHYEGQGVPSPMRQIGAWRGDW